MSNGRTELDREGCEYGRQLKKDNDYLKEDVKEIKSDLKELIKKVDKIAQQVDRANIFTVIGTTVVGSLAGFFASWLKGGGS
ncbi:MAG: hypothetical protein WBK86_00515 [Halanaerobiales bacterium]